MLKMPNFVRKHFLLTSLILAAALIVGWYGIKASLALYEVNKVVNDTFNVSLARDAKTEKYLGEVVAERKDEKTGKVVGYRIKLNDGSVIERSADSIVVFQP
jgi:hypothetical protein